MTGNDIIDIAAAVVQSNWSRKGFLEKIFTPVERQYIRESHHPGKMVWVLWSMKESAYKIYTRQYGGRFFAPQKFRCSLSGENSGLVTIEGISYDTVTTITPRYIYSVAKPAGNKTGPFVNECFYSKHTAHLLQHRMAVKRMIRTYSTLTGKLIYSLSVVKDDNGAPYLFNGEEQLYIPVSITHHGHYIAFTIS